MEEKFELTEETKNELSNGKGDEKEENADE